MNVLIAGCGRVGQALVLQLNELGHEVSVVDESRENLQALHDAAGSSFDSVLAVVGIPIDVDVLKSAGIESCDAVAAVTPDNNINIMVAQMAQQVFGVKNVIARISDPSRKEVFTQRFGLRAVCGTTLTVQSMLAGLLNEEEDEKQFVAFGSSTANFYAEPVADEYLNKPLSEVLPPRDDMMVYGVQRANNTLELATNPSPVLHRDDKIIYSIVVD